jgi:hypothetical protein
MLQAITWGQFISFLFYGLIFYYGRVAWKFRLWERRPRPKDPAPQQENPGVENASPAQPEPASQPPAAKPLSPSQITEALLLALRSKFKEAADKHEDKATIESGIRTILSTQPELIGTPYEPVINGFLKRTCFKEFCWELKPEEITKLWKN